MDLKSPRPISTVRRNPPRRAKQTPSTNAPVTSKSSSATAAASIPPFPIHEILDADPPKIPPPTPKRPESAATPSEPQIPPPTPNAEDPAEIPPPTPNAEDPAQIPPPTPNAEDPAQIPPPTPKPAEPITNSSPENLKVFLRIRPLLPRPKPARPIPGSGHRARGKGTSPKNGKIKSNNICLVVNGSGSVTLSAPSSPLDSKRSKSEVYDGFSHVFPPDSIQKEIYERVMDPLVMDFIGGRSALLAAMGPTGSGKTHTIFGCPREPGLVPLAIQKIFGHESNNEESHSSRSCYLSMFEIYSERGKGERIFDLLSDGADLNLQQSTIKGLQQVMISNIAEADSLIAHGMLKRATAVTNANSQSSRSQCIINICNGRRSLDDENDIPENIAVLTIADLAGAEREKKTGNQGARLLESSFINNTSMVFGLCLRSLLEHQKNPKKPFQKHFKNSLLTRYLKDFLEGKKRMTLMLTVKPGEDDYLDTSFLLRQASPYMKIKFTSHEEFPNVPSQKRSTTTMLRVEHHKRRKYNLYEASQVKDGKNGKDAVSELQVSDEGDDFKKHHGIESPQRLNASPHSEKAPRMGIQLNEDYYAEMQKMKKNDEVMQKFAKALWNVLKQYKEKLEVSENEVQNLKEALNKKTTQNIELKKQLKESGSCSCQMSLKESSNSEVICERAEGYPVTERNPVSHFMGILLDANLTEGDESTISSTVEQNMLSVEDKLICRSDSFPGGELSHENLEVSTGCGVKEISSDLEMIENSFEDSSCRVRLSLVDGEMIPCPSMEIFTQVVENKKQPTDQSCNHFKGKEHDSEDLERNSIEVKDMPHTAKLSEIVHSDPFISTSRPSTMRRDAEDATDEHRTLHEEEQPELHSSLVEDAIQNIKSRVKNPMEKENLGSDFNNSNGKKPKRRLLPASAMLLKSFSGLDMAVENLKESRGKTLVEGMGRSQGSMSLVRLLKKSLHQ